MILIIAYGNSLRRDDGAGLVLGELLEREWTSRSLPVRRLAVHQLAPELSEEIAGDGVSAVVFVDAAVATAGASELRPQISRIGLEPPSATLGHHLDPATLLTYARLLYGRQPPAWMVTVPGLDFGHGEGLSEAVQGILETAPALVDEALLPALPGGSWTTDEG